MNFPDNFLDIEEMEKCGLDKGRISSKTHPRMRPFLMGVKTPFYLFNLQKTKEYFERALSFMKESLKEGKKILVIETRPPFQDLIKDFAQRHSLSYIVSRFLGGTFTNFETMKKRIEHLKKMEEEKASGAWEKYTKKEQMLLDKRMEKLKKKFEGLKNLEALPDIVLMFNTDKDHLAIKEARRKKIKIVAVCDTNANPDLIDYPIPCSNNSLLALKYIVKKIEDFVFTDRVEKLEQEEEKKVESEEIEQKQ